MKNRFCGLLTAVLAAGFMFTVPAYGQIVWTEQENGTYTTADAGGNLIKSQWLYEDDTNTWYYMDGEGNRAVGRLELYGETYFLDEDGKMLTGWVEYLADGKASAFAALDVDEDTYYCYDDGRMAKSTWISAYEPDYMEDGGAEDGMESYYINETGRVAYNRKKSVEGKRYILKEDGTRMTGWIYDRGEGESDRYLAVDTDSDGGLKELCREHPENMMYANPDTGELTVKGWIDAIPPWDNEGDSSRSFYANPYGYIVTAKKSPQGGRGIVARRKARKIKTIGTYQFEDWSTDVNIVRIGGKYYCLEDSGTRLDGLLFLSQDNGEPRFRDGLYSFGDNAAMQTGEILIDNTGDGDGNDDYHYYYCFSDKSGSRGRGICGVKNGRLYYHGLAVGAQEDSYEPVYLPTIEEADKTGKGTGMFLVDMTGKVKKGTAYTSFGYSYKVSEIKGSDGDYGYRIDCSGEKDGNNRKVWSTLQQGDCDYICWDEVEE